MSNDPGLYDYIPYNRRPKITWPNGAKIAVWIAPNIELTVVEVHGNKVRLGFEAPRDVSIHRQEVHQRIQYESCHEAQLTCPP